VLGGDVGLRCRELLREIARSKEMIIYAGSINRGHVHILIGIPPSISVSKEKNSHKMLTEFPTLKEEVLAEALMDDRYEIVLTLHLGSASANVNLFEW